jgi:hypothetical protein
VAVQRVISLREFAKAMIEADDAFAHRVQDFERCFGPADADTLALLAQAATFCWHNHEYRANLAELCRAVAKGVPTTLYSHCQVTRGRWAELHSYVVGVQCWLGVDLPLPAGIDSAVVERIGHWLGERSRAKEALAALLLTQLVDDLFNYVSFSKLAGDGVPGTDGYADFAPWYVGADGTRYAVEHELAPADGHRFRWKNEAMGPLVEDLAGAVCREMRGAPEDAQELVEGILRLSQPPCMHRFQHYLDIQLTSIGALRWRGARPPDDLSRAKWQAFWDGATGGLQAWLNGDPPCGELAVQLHESLGRPTEQGRAIVHDFFLADRPGMGVSWDWLMQKAQIEGTTACTAFQDHAP